jgi:hypothetical protein
MFSVERFGLVCGMYLGYRYGYQFHNFVLDRNTTVKTYYNSHLRNWVSTNPIFTETQLINFFGAGTGCWMVYNFQAYVPIIPLVGIFALATLSRDFAIYFPNFRNDIVTNNNNNNNNKWWQKWRINEKQQDDKNQKK